MLQLLHKFITRFKYYLFLSLFVSFINKIQAQSIKIEYQQQFENISVNFDEQYDLLISDTLSLYLEKKRNGVNGLKGNNNQEIILFNDKKEINKKYYLNYTSNFLFCEEYYGESLIIKEKDSLIYKNWQFTDSTKIINNYNCKLAIKEFRGRKYYVWYTSDILTKFGPWKFANLHGLVIQAYDEKREFNLNAIKISNLTNEDKNIITQLATRENFLNKKIYSIQEFQDKLSEHRKIILNRINNSLPESNRMKMSENECDDCGNGLENY